MKTIDGNCLDNCLAICDVRQPAKMTDSKPAQEFMMNMHLTKSSTGTAAFATVSPSAFPWLAMINEDGVLKTIYDKVNNLKINLF